MKTKEHYIEEYINYLYGDIEEDRPIYQPDINQTKTDFKAGFDLAEELFKPKWISVDEQLPDNDREVLLYVRDLLTPHWSGNKLGSYIDGKWYLKGGTQNYYECVRWLDISSQEELKTSEEWSEIFNNVIVLDPDGWERNSFQFSWFEELITERVYTNRLLLSTTVLRDDT